MERMPSYYSNRNALFFHICWICHGNRWLDDPPGKLLTPVLAGAVVSRMGKRLSLRNGKPRPSAPPENFQPESQGLLLSQPTQGDPHASPRLFMFGIYSIIKSSRHCKTMEMYLLWLCLFVGFFCCNAITEERRKFLSACLCAGGLGAIGMYRQDAPNRAIL